MKPSRMIFVLGMAAACLAVRAGLHAAADDLLKIEASVRPKSLSRGEEGNVVLRVTAGEGISLSPHPSFTIEFSPCPELVFPKKSYTHSDLDIEVLEDEEGKSLNMSDPVEIPFTVSLQAKRGSHILQGKVKYFAYSKKEGWCLKDTAKFSVSFSTRQLSIK
ncbi:MAG: hypothetical protein JW747_06370 [Candidatus Aminicenantes bacterium]|nr:hypothetical protein [Candidatus Aminicenantes bacterium]